MAFIWGLLSQSPENNVTSVPLFWVLGLESGCGLVSLWGEEHLYPAPPVPILLSLFLESGKACGPVIPGSIILHRALGHPYWERLDEDTPTPSSPAWPGSSVTCMRNRKASRGLYQESWSVSWEASKIFIWRNMEPLRLDWETHIVSKDKIYNTKTLQKCWDRQKAARVHSPDIHMLYTQRPAWYWLTRMEYAVVSVQVSNIPDQPSHPPPPQK